MAVVHATEQQLADYPVTVPAGVDAGLLLLRASRDVDAALLCAVYDVDDDGVATDADVLAALRDATCEQVAGMIAAGAYPGAPAARGGFAIGKVRVDGGVDTVERVQRGQLYSQAWRVLQQAGLTGQGPQTW